MSLTYNAGANYYSEFTTQRFDTGAITDADSLPTATATKNGVDDGAFTLTCAKLSTGRYKITGTVPSYTLNDVVQVSVLATVNSIPGGGIVDQFKIGYPQTGDSFAIVNDSTNGNAAIKTAVAANTTGIASNGTAIAANGTAITANGTAIAALPTTTTVNAIKAKTDNLPSSPAATGAKMDIVDAPNSTALSAIAAAVGALVVDGAITVSSALKKLFARMIGASARTGSAVAYKNQSGATELTETYTDSSRTPS